MDWRMFRGESDLERKGESEQGKYYESFIINFAFP